jgi:ABC-type glutathione transport system ATPase component
VTEPDAGLAILARDLSLEYPRRGASPRHTAVAGVSFEVRHGEILAIVGEAGAGKSTLALALAGYAGLDGERSPEIAGGSLSVLGADLRRLGPRKRERLHLSIGHLPQDAGSRLDPHLTIGENVAEPIYSRDRRFDRRAAGEAVAAAIDIVRLPLGAMTKYPFELSRGQRQRAALAKALVLEPPLLVADDFSSGVDVTARAGVLDALRDIRRTRQFSAVLVGSDFADVAKVADRIAVMHRGVFLAIGTLEQLFEHPDHPYLKTLSRAMTGDLPTTGAVPIQPTRREDR